MINLVSSNDINKLIKYQLEAIEVITEIIKILDGNYELNRIANDLGDILIPENIVDIEIFKQDKLKNLIP
ncbi:hypothetical protein [Clostridium sp. UBA5712]|uniref:hypothetical protein n=1 Tax=Clostridium sp. UBA5712 TaxID=1946368 RepID=UPI003217953E